MLTTADTPKTRGNRDPASSKAAFLAGLPRAIRQRIEAAYPSGDLGHGVPIPRNTRPDGSNRRGEHPEWLYRLVEASFAVEDAIEHEASAPPSRRTVVDELRRRRNAVLDAMGENETRVTAKARAA